MVTLNATFNCHRQVMYNKMTIRLVTLLFKIHIIKLNNFLQYLVNAKNLP